MKNILQQLEKEINECFELTKDYQGGLIRAKDVILSEQSEQKEPCEYCNDGVYHDVLGSPCKYNYCPMCGRPLNQLYTE